MKKKIVAIAGKLRRYPERVNRVRQNRMFQNNDRFIGNSIRKEKDVMMISQMMKNQKSFGETFGVNQYIIIGMQNG